MRVLKNQSCLYSRFLFNLVKYCDVFLLLSVMLPKCYIDEGGLGRNSLELWWFSHLGKKFFFEGSFFQFEDHKLLLLLIVEIGQGKTYLEAGEPPFEVFRSL